jgi:hypothetical protein
VVLSKSYPGVCRLHPVVRAGRQAAFYTIHHIIMTPLLAVLEFSDYGIVVLILFAFIGLGKGSNDSKMTVLRLEVQVRGLQQKLDALLKHQGIVIPTPTPSDLSPELQLMAKEPSQKIAAIKRYREENPGIGLAEAKQRIEEFSKTGK